MSLFPRFEWLPGATLHAAAIAAATIVILCCFSSASAQSLPGYQGPDKPKQIDNAPPEVKAKRGQAPLNKLYGQLKADESKTKRLRPLKDSEKRQKSEKLFQIGVVRRLATALNPLNDSALYAVPEGEVRVASVVTEGALYTRLHFRRMSLPAGARVFVYSMANPDEYYGPYEGHGPSDDGTFWTPPMRGDAVAVEYFTPAATRADAPFKIPEVSHIYKDALANDPADFCEQEVQTPWSFVKSSVGLLQFTTGGLEAICTGTLMNNAANDQKPYLLTANHCIGTQTEAQSLRVYWDYNVGDFPTGFTTDGANLLATGTGSDFAFLFLTGTMPGGRFFSGWDASNFGGTATANDIHHPNGSHKRQSAGNARQPTSGAECDLSGSTDLQCVAVDWTSGVTEPGSSGSPLWTGSPSDSGGPKLIGTLTGGPSSCDAAPADKKDFFGRFSVTYPFIAQFVDNTACNTTLTPTNQSFSAAGGGGSFTVTSACSWTAVSTASFVTITPPANGSGNGTVNFSVAANTGMQRSATIVVGSKAFVVNQDAGGPCVPQSINFGETKNGTLAVSDCALVDGSVADAYTFTGTAGQQISISMSSIEFDTWLYLYKPNGGVLAADDDGGGGTNSRIPSSSGFLTLPLTGTYLIFANSFDPANAGGVGAYSLTLTERPKTTLTVNSTPDSGVAITVTPNDLNGNGDGSTQFIRTYYQNQTVVLNAPGIANGKEFKEWQKDGVTVPSSTNVVTVGMDTNHTMTAVYGPITTFTLTIQSQNPNTGVDISVSPNDNGAQGNGTTTFTRTYNKNTFVNVTAPLTAPNGNIFQKWQRDGVDVSTDRFLLAFTDNNHTLTAFYVAPSTFTLSVSAQNPSTGINITVTPNDNGGFGNGTAPFTRTYQQLTSVTLSAPATAPNGNIFDRWTSNGNTFDFNRTTTFTINTNMSLVAEYATTPVVWKEEGTNNVAAINSVTLLRGPFQILDPHNFATDGHTRIILFVSNLPGNDPSLGVVVPNMQLPIEAVGQLNSVPGMAGTTGIYIVCKLPDGLPNGALQLNVMYKGITSQPVTLNIIP
jgi:hypothetical protein